MDRQEAGKQVGRLCGLPFFPADAAGIAELLDAMLDSCDTVERAKAVIDEILFDADECPTPATIRRVAANMKPPGIDEHPTGCNLCERGWIHTVINGYECARRCECTGAKQS